MDIKELKDYYLEIISQNKGILLKIARAYCQNEDDRQDLIQEMMLQIWLALPKYENTYKISTWMYRIALNVAISFYRNNKRRIESSVPLSEKYIQIRDEGVDTEQELILLYKFIAELRELDKALVLLYLEDRSHAEIAEILGLTIGNVGTKVGRIKEKLRQRFLRINLI